jgi:hypothetical protein
VTSGDAEMTPADGTDEFLALRPRLLGIAYRLLGSMWDAEDVVADAMERWLRTDRSEVLEVNGEPAVQIALGGQDSLVALEVRDGRVRSILTVLNPDKLTYLARQTADA